MTSARDAALKNLQDARHMTLAMYEGVPADKLAIQLPGARNHFLFTLGHLGAATNFFTAAVGGQGIELTPKYQELFGYGAKPQPGVAPYPPLDELKAFAERSLAAFVAAARAVPEDRLEQPCANGGGGFLASPLDAIFKLAWHEGWHAGQLAPLRRELGLPSIMG